MWLDLPIRGNVVSIALILQAQASEQLGALMPRERQQKEYNQALVKRYHHLHDVKRIERHRHLPAPIYKVQTLLSISPLTMHKSDSMI